jgi:hypothetical protein
VSGVEEKEVGVANSTEGRQHNRIREHIRKILRQLGDRGKHDKAKAPASVHPSSGGNRDERERK